MKRKSVRMMLCAILAFGMIAMTACGSKGGDAQQSGNQVENDADAPADNADDASAPEENTDDTSADSSSSNGKFASMEEYVNSDEVQAEIATLFSTYKDQGLEIAVTGEGNKLIYTYTYLDELADVDAVAAALEEGVEAQKSTFAGIASTLKMVVDVDDPVVVIRYLDSNGGEIYTTEIGAE